MLRRLASVGVVSLGVMCMAIRPHEAPPPPPSAKLPAPPPPSAKPPAPPPPVVPTANKVVKTPPVAPPLASATPPSAAPPAATAPNSVEAARQGVVVLERQGKPLALGVVLDSDG